jgi:RimJ/RimL family protein N-acetyltransferase
MLRAEESADFFGLASMYEQFEPKKLAQGLPPGGRRQRLKWLKNLERNCFNLIALHSSRVIGHTILTDLGPGKSAELAVFIHQGYRHNGLGTLMAKLALQCARQSQCKQMWALVQRYNRPALQICRKTGMSIVCGLLEPEMELRMRLDGQPTSL